MFLVKFEREKVNTAQLTAMQEGAPLLPFAMRAYIEWLRPQLDDLAEHLPKRLVELRKKALVEGHARLPENVAHLMLGMEMFTEFAVAAGAITQEGKGELDSKAWHVLLCLASQQARNMAAERPAVRFLRALAELLNTGQLRLYHRTTGESLNPLPLSDGELAGWWDEEGLYLLPEAVWKAVSELLRADGGLGLSKRAVFEQLVKEGFAAPGTQGRSTKTVKIKGMVKRVLHLYPDALARAVQAEEEQNPEG
ncbi:MAG: hypothetical protein ACPLRU_05610 [Desulfofundulus sp.]